MSQFECIQSFDIDGPDYTDRDRLMFVCGFEFSQICKFLLAGDFKITNPPDLFIHKENEDRVTKLLQKHDQWFEMHAVNEVWTRVSLCPF